MTRPSRAAANVFVAVVLVVAAVLVIAVFLGYPAVEMTLGGPVHCDAAGQPVGCFPG